LEVIHTTLPVAPHPFSVHPRVPEAQAQAVKLALLKLAHSPEGKTLLRCIRTGSIFQRCIRGQYPAGRTGRDSVKLHFWWRIILESAVGRVEGYVHGGEVSPGTQTSIDMDTLVPLLHQLNESVANDNVKATDLMTQLTPLLNGSEYNSHLATLARSVGNYEFDAALDAVQDLAKAIDVIL
jgi:hypothetical protein